MCSMQKQPLPPFVSLAVEMKLETLHFLIYKSPFPSKLQPLLSLSLSIFLSLHQTTSSPAVISPAAASRFSSEYSVPMLGILFMRCQILSVQVRVFHNLQFCFNFFLIFNAVSGSSFSVQVRVL